MQENELLLTVGLKVRLQKTYYRIESFFEKGIDVPDEKYDILEGQKRLKNLSPNSMKQSKR